MKKNFKYVLFLSIGLVLFFAFFAFKLQDDKKTTGPYRELCNQYANGSDLSFEKLAGQINALGSGKNPKVLASVAGVASTENFDKSERMQLKSFLNLSDADQKLLNHWDRLNSEGTSSTEGQVSIIVMPGRGPSRFTCNIGFEKGKVIENKAFDGD
ncbi:MAG: hypothetical protein ACK5WZ_10265 [Pseudobdellovibrionaceae bacterium]